MPEQPRAQIHEPSTCEQRRLPGGRHGFRRAFTVFKIRNYRIFFIGQVISLIGSWLQTTAEGWLVYQLSGSSVALGFIRAASMMPFALLALWGGLIADRHSRRAVLLTTQGISMLLALSLALLVWLKVIEVWHVAVVGLLLGTVNAFDVPTRQAFVVDLVGRDDLDHGIALNSSMFNLARVVGPAVAGLLIGVVGIAGCFFLNGLSYIAVLAGYGMLRLPKHIPRADHPPFGKAIREAGAHVMARGPLRNIILLVSTYSLFGMGAQVLMPVFVKDVLGGGATAFGAMLACNGGGALLGGLSLAGYGKAFHRRHLIFVGLFGSSLFYIAFACSHWAWLSGLFLTAAGYFMIVFLASANTGTQLRSPDALRGRIMGFYTLAFMGMSAVGSLLSGWAARHIGAPATVAAGGLVCIAVGLFMFRRISPQPLVAPEAGG